MTIDRIQVAKVARQIGSSLLDDNDQWTNRFEIASRTSGSRYVIAQRKADGQWGYSCWAWKRNRCCKHLEDVLSRLAAVAESTPAAYEPAVRKMLIEARTAYLDSQKIAVTRSVGRVLDLGD